MFTTTGGSFRLFLIVDVWAEERWCRLARASDSDWSCCGLVDPGVSVESPNQGDSTIAVEPSAAVAGEKTVPCPPRGNNAGSAPSRGRGSDHRCARPADGPKWSRCRYRPTSLCRVCTTAAARVFTARSCDILSVTWQRSSPRDVPTFTFSTEFVGWTDEVEQFVGFCTKERVTQNRRSNSPIGAKKDIGAPGEPRAREEPPGFFLMSTSEGSSSVRRDEDEDAASPPPPPGTSARMSKALVPTWSAPSVIHPVAVPGMQ
mmetsp:Transcript_8559/g.20777  ORF Transcript_8559/g.20777 Transcript_8559/m.20777 type:complete len:260 (+) Transcript_8559:1172-1951(+)